MPAYKTSFQEELDKRTLISLINSMSDGVLALDPDLKVTVYNASALGLLDVNVIDKNSSIQKLFNLYNDKDLLVDIKKLIKKTTIEDVYRDFRIKYNDGSYINLFLSISSVRLNYQEKSPLGYVLLFRDITKEKSLEEERNEFISVVSHELRTPIAISEGNISNALFLVDKTKDINQVKSALQETHNQIMFLSDMINDLATLSRAERGILKVELEDINVVNLIDELDKEYSPEITQKGLVLKKEVSPEIKLLKTSPLYLKEILQNFITNSIKYTQAGFISILAKPYSEGVIFEITDSGIGISKQDQKKVFDKFFRSGDYRTSQVKGTGLGLYVTMKLIKLIKADVELESKLNHGSTFRLKVPNI